MLDRDPPGSEQVPRNPGPGRAPGANSALTLEPATWRQPGAPIDNRRNSLARKGLRRFSGSAGSPKGPKSTTVRQPSVNPSRPREGSDRLQNQTESGLLPLRIRASMPPTRPARSRIPSPNSEETAMQIDDALERYLRQLEADEHGSPER